jgi:hypothetical protein
MFAVVRRAGWAALLGAVVATLGASATSPFTIVALPDTQFYCRDNQNSVGGPLDFFDQQTKWVVNNAASQNIKFVTQLGDVVNTAGGVGSASREWGVAVNAMNTLKTSSVPHSILAGNHDWTNSAGTGSLEHYRVRFGNTSGYFNGKSWFLGYDERGVNSAQRFSTPIGDVLHIALEFNAANPAQSSDFAPGTPANPIAWAQGVINAHAGVPTFISIHNNVNTSGVRDGRGNLLFNTLVKDNNQVFMVLNGHYASGDTGEALISSTNSFGRPVYEMLTDYQGRNRGGDGWMRLLRFDPDNNRITAQTYTTRSDALLGVPAGAEFGNVGRVETDSNSNLVLPLDFSTRFLAPPPPPPSQAFAFQNGLNGYSGTEDTQIRQLTPTTTAGTATNIGVDSDEGTTLDQVRQSLVKFSDVIGSGAGQVPADRDVVSATLTIFLNDVSNVNAAGSGIRVHRLTAGWTEATANWNNLGSVNDGVVITDPTGAAKTLDALAVADDQQGGATGGANIGPGIVEFDVTDSLRAQLNGAANHGWALLPFAPGGTNGVFFDSSEATAAGSIRPRLEVKATASAVQLATFRQGLNGYAGTQDTMVNQAQSTTAFGSLTTLVVDASVENNGSAAGSDQAVLLRFDDVFGGGVGQIPQGLAEITSGVLKLDVPADVQFSEGSGFSVYRLTRAWDESSTWASLASGITIGEETAILPDDVEGVNTLNAIGVGQGVVYLDVTESLRAWASGAENFGWAILPPANATNAVIFASSESGGLRPELAVRYLQIDPFWLTNGSGNWGDAANWKGGVPNSAGAAANFVTALGAPAAVTLGGPRTAGTVKFDSSAGYTIQGSQLTLDNNGLAAVIEVVSGSHTITSDMVAVDGLKLLGGGLTLAGGLVVNGELDVAGGEVRLTGTTAVVSELLIGGVLNVTDTSLVVDYNGASPIAEVIAYVLGGQLAFNGDVGGLPTYLAIAEAADLGLSEFGGIVLDESAVVAKFTFVGDANLDGRVDALDYERVDLAIGNAGALGTAQGDLNYDGRVDALDYEQIDLNIGNGVGGVPSGVFVPEPGSASLVGLAAGLLLRRR